MLFQEISAQKKILRKTVATRIMQLSNRTRQVYDLELQKNFDLFLSQKLQLNPAKPPLILSYMPLSDEPAIPEIIQPHNRFRIALPVTNNNNTLTPRISKGSLTTGRFDILEPTTDSPAVAYQEITLAVIPGRAFTPDGKRLGRGKGYYDRLLASCNCLTVALAYDEQIFTEIPVAEHDQNMDFIITPSAIYPQLAR